MPTISEILEKCPAKISFYCQKENDAYATMIQSHNDYKILRSKKYLQRRSNEGTVTIKDLEYALDSDQELTAIKDKELLAEIDYRACRQKKEYYKDLFQSACEKGRNMRSELHSLKDTINENRPT